MAYLLPSLDFVAFIDVEAAQVAVVDVPVAAAYRALYNQALSAAVRKVRP
jgi:hypothetical protein